jgi:hypothetical protein
MWHRDLAIARVFLHIAVEAHMVSHSKTLAFVLGLGLLAASACSCPPVNNSGAGHANTSRDPSSVTFAFFGGLRCFFGDSGAQPDDKTSRPVCEGDLTSAPTDPDTGTHTASLTIR